MASIGDAIRLEAMPALQRFADNPQLGRFDRDDPPPYTTYDSESGSDFDAPFHPSLGLGLGKDDSDSPGRRFQVEVEHETSLLGAFRGWGPSNYWAKEFLKASSGRQSLRYSPIVRCNIRRRWQKLGIWNPAWGIPGRQDRQPNDDTDTWKWKWEQDIPFDEKHPAMRAVRLRQGLRHAERNPPPPFSKLNEDAAPGQAESFIISRPWFTFSVEKAEQMPIDSKPMMKERDRRRFDALSEWAQQHGAKLHPSLEIYDDDITKFSIRAKETATDALEPGFAAFSCPLPITLSYLNALVGGPITPSAPPGQKEPAFPPRFISTLPPHVVGRFFLMQQYLEGDDSFWWPYLATLPQPEHVSSWALPAFWPEDDVDFLEGTNAQVAIEEIQANVKREFKQARKILKEDDFPNWQDYTRVLYNWAFCIFTSRSFRPSLILTQPGKEHVEKLLPQGCQVDGFSILQPLFDIGNHSITSSYSWDLVSDPNSCRLICQDAYRPGDQVYNNYGLKTNSELLLGYGFVLPETNELHNDYVHVRKRGRGGDDSTASDKPKDFLISLRPISHHSSVVIRAREIPSSAGSRLHLLSEFAHFEPALVYDLAAAVSTPEEIQIMEQSTEETPQGGLEALIKRVKEALTAKLQFDYQKLIDVDQVEEEDRIKPTNRNQQLAVNYRRQCEKVLLASLEALA
ncbi:hypothetical protein B0H63DRAFT_560546 [Podospora didyma]|uniref:SET domain-containing protein n=1 Tax=Podospora didyma TaxID=330526 RepID=A0AAE0NQY5_9PEZI|nr:hypothetical protein B0H63DRAFT_560546 [Podospora didyma]